MYKYHLKDSVFKEMTHPSNAADINSNQKDYKQEATSHASSNRTKTNYIVGDLVTRMHN